MLHRQQRTPTWKRQLPFLRVTQSARSSSRSRRTVVAAAAQRKMIIGREGWGIICSILQVHNEFLDDYAA